MHAIVQVPRAVSRLIISRATKARQFGITFTLASSSNSTWPTFSPVLLLDGVHAFRVTRTATFTSMKKKPTTCCAGIEAGTAAFEPCNAVRLEVEADCLTTSPIGSLSFSTTAAGSLAKVERSTFDDPSRAPARRTTLSEVEGSRFPADPPTRRWPPHAEYFRSDAEAGHPASSSYESYDPVVELVESAASDPAVLALKITLYRRGGDSPGRRGG